jgi:small-conductance mechanosensitive channel
MAKGNPLHMKHTLKRQWLLGIIAGVITLAAVGLGKAYGSVTNSSTSEKLISWSAAIVVLIAGAYAIQHVATALGRLLARNSSIGAGATLRLVVTGVGYLLLLFALFGVLGVSLQHLLIGAGLAGVILGIAAQQSLGNIFASIVLLVARPFVVGDNVRVRSGVVGVLDVKVLGIGLTYVTVQTDDGILKIPNSVLLASGIGQPQPPSPASPADPNNAATPKDHENS